MEVKERLAQILEALLLAADQPLSVEQLFRMFMAEGGITKKDVKAALDLLGRQLDGRAVELREVASGYRLQVRAEYAEWVGKLWQERPPRFSRALLETLALVCYRQPITRGEIENVRGVTVNPNIIRTLSERGWIRVVGHREVPGHPELLGTTRDFLDYFGLRSLDELPSLAALRDMDDVGIQLEFDEPVTVQAAPADQPAANDADASS